MQQREHGSAPTEGRGAQSEAGAGSRLTPILSDLDVIARHVDGTFVLVVKVADGKYRRRCFLTAASAERAARKAQDAGQNAVVVLAELKPLYRVSGGDRDG